MFQNVIRNITVTQNLKYPYRRWHWGVGVPASLEIRPDLMLPGFLIVGGIPRDLFYSH